MEVHGERTQAAVRSQPERWVLIKNLAVEVHADVRLHILRAVVEYLRTHTLIAAAPQSRPTTQASRIYLVRI